MLNKKELDFIECYLTTKNITDTANKLNISRTTVYDYLKKDAIKEEIRERTEQQIQDTKVFLQESLYIANGELLKMIKSEMTADNIKLQAINTLYNQVNKFCNIAEHIEEKEKERLFNII
jgi:hypothetical protein